MTPTNTFGQPVGTPLDWVPRPRPEPVFLQGKGIRLEPLDARHDVDLYVATARLGSDPSWTYLGDEKPADRESMATMLQAKRDDPTRVPFAIVPLETEKPAGYCSLMHIDGRNGVVEVGDIHLSRQLQRTRGSTETLYLLMHHVFEDLGYRRLEWKCDSLNEPSRKAALRLGFVWEGRFRHAVVYKNRNRDTDWFSITDRDWPRVRRALEDWLDDGNFDEHGNQLTRLAARATKGEPT